MKKILVPSDLSTLSEKALTLAVDISNKTNGEIHLVNFHKHPFGKTFSATGEMDQKVSQEENLYTLQLLKKNFQRLGELATKYPSAEIRTQIFDEDFNDGVISFIKDNKIDMVVMGTTGEENAKEFFTGNHAQQVIESAPCPVLTVRENDVLGNFEKLAVGVDFDKDSKDNYLKAVGYINDLANELNSKIHLVHINHDKARGDQDRLEKFAKDYNITNYEVAVVDSKDQEAGLIGYGHKINAGAVAVLTHADGGFFRAFERNTSEEINKKADLPILTINLHKV